MNQFKKRTDSLYRFFIRNLAFVSKEIRTILHQPRLIFSLILGPFLILLIFGLGYNQQARVRDTLFVVPEGSPMIAQVEKYSDNLPTNINYLGMTSDPAVADARLRQGEVDLVISTPRNPAENWRNNTQATFTLFHNEIDPIEESYVHVLGQRSIDQLNQLVLLEVADEAKDEANEYQENVKAAAEEAGTVRRALEEGDVAAAEAAMSGLQEDLGLLSATTGAGITLLSQLEPVSENVEDGTLNAITSRLQQIQQNLDQLSQVDPSQSDFSEEIALASQVETDLNALDNLLTEFRETDSDVLVKPFVNETLSVINTNLQPTHFYVPGVIALLLQHIAITMSGLSIVRERKEGAMELFQAAPVSAFETLLGKYLSFIITTGVLAAILTALVIWGLGVPMLGAPDRYVAAIAALLITSLGIGFHISLSAQSDSQAIQFSMIVLLASIFFSGFFLPLYRLQTFVQVVSWMLPATYGTQLLQNIMLRGQTGSLLQQGVLILASIFLFLLAWWRLRRQMNQE